MGNAKIIKSTKIKKFKKGGRGGRKSPKIIKWAHFIGPKALKTERKGIMKVKSIPISSQSLFPDYVTLKHPLLIYKLHSRHADKPEKVSNEKVKENSKESGG